MKEYESIWKWLNMVDAVFLLSSPQVFLTGSGEAEKALIDLHKFIVLSAFAHGCLCPVFL